MSENEKTPEQQKMIEDLKAKLEAKKIQKEIPESKPLIPVKEEKMKTEIIFSTNPILKRIQEIELEYDSVGSIPINSEYWALKNQLNLSRNQ